MSSRGGAAGASSGAPQDDLAASETSDPETLSSTSLGAGVEPGQTGDPVAEGDSGGSQADDAESKHQEERYKMAVINITSTKKSQC